MLSHLRFPVLLSCTAAFMLAHVAAAGATEARYLNWNNKSDYTVAEPRNERVTQGHTEATQAIAHATVSAPHPVSTASGPSTYYGIPPSPYGQVGAMGPRSTASVYMPAAPTAAAVTQPAPRLQPQIQPAAMASAPPPPNPAPRVNERALPPVAAAPQPRNYPAPSVPATDTAMHVTGGYTDSGYQVPQSSPYASRIAAARASQASPPPLATAPSLSTPLSEAATQAYIPAEAMTASAAENEPRFYSLHRQYGLEPDPLPPSQPSQGALLVPSTLLEDDWSADERDTHRKKPAD